MDITTEIKPGDFTHLATSYTKYRPSYSEVVLKAILGVINKPIHQINFVDVGAGTGIWTRLVAKKHCQSITAIEPNDEMRTQGKMSNGELNITWLSGSAEKTNLPDSCADLVSMASSFHWANFELATQEFYRILKPEGYFLVLWNPRYLENNPLLVEIENYMYELNPNMNRVSSGSSKNVNQLAKKLESCPLFSEPIYMEAKDTVTLTKEAYLGAWQSVNDVRVQLGENKFKQFLEYINQKLKNHSTIDCTYLTRAWMMKRN